MSRRGTPQVLAFVAVGVVFVYGFYSYNELKSAVRRSDETVKRWKLENENLSTQLLAANEGKAKLQSSAETDRKKCEYSKEELLRLKSDQETRFKQEKKDLTDRYVKISEELKQVKENYDNVDRELRRHHDLDGQHEDERAQLKQAKQESDNEIAVLRDETANLKRQVNLLRKQLADRIADPSKKPLQVAEDGKADVKDSQHFFDNRIHQMGGRQDEDHEVRMQINKPDDNERKPYFEPREAKPDHPLMKRAAPGVVAVNQVAAPDVQNELDNPEIAKPAKSRKFDAEDKLDLVERFGHHRNPIMPNDRHENDAMNAARANEPDFGKLGKFRRDFDDGMQAGDVKGQMEKPMQIAEPRMQQEEDQLQNPQNDEDNADEKEDDAADADDDNEDEYQYHQRKEANRRPNDGHRAAPVVNEDDVAQDGL